MDIDIDVINIETSHLAKVRFSRLALVIGLAAIAVGFIVGVGRQTMAHAQLFSVGLITDERTLADKGINWMSYKGLLQAEQELGVAIQVYTSTSPADYDLKLGVCAADANGLCIAAGARIADAVYRAALAHPNTQFALLDFEFETYPENLSVIRFAEDEVGYLAGTLAARMSGAGWIGVVGDGPDPHTQAFVNGYRNGARCADRNTTVAVRYADGFEGSLRGAEAAQELLESGADVIFGATGEAGLAAVLTATQAGVWGVGVDTDYYLNVFQEGAVGGADWLLTSAIKRYDTAVYDVVAQAQAGNFAPGVTLFDLARNGVGLAPFHQADPHVPQSARDALESVRLRILAGRLDVTESCAQNTLYVDGMTGRDEGDCSDSTAPCRTIVYALALAARGDAILVAGGTYTENLVIQDGVMLKGGFSGTPDWTRDVAAHPTILDGSSAPTVWGDWDGNAIRAPVVISDSGQYRMWYDGFNPTRQMWGWAVGTAESPDGTHWTKYSANPILGPGEPGEWDSSYRGAGSVLQEDGLYRMYYSGNDGELWQTGLATSTEGVYWNLYGAGPVLPAGAAGSWDEQEAAGPTVLTENRVYRMWYHGCNAGYSACSIGYATSTNGIDWFKFSGNPVLTATSETTSAPTLAWPSVISHTTISGTLYEMWYATEGGVGRATSADGIHWSPDADNPVWGNGWTGFPGHRPSVLWDGNLYRMWVGDDGSTGASIRYLESGDGRAWTQPTNSPVLTAGAPGQWGKPVVQYLPGSSGAVLDGFVVTGGDAEAGAGIRVDSAAVLIMHSAISANIAMADNGGGLRAENGAIVRVEDAHITDNWAPSGAGVAAETGSHVTLVRTRVTNNKANDSGGGIAVANGASVRAQECYVRDNEAYGTGGGVFAAAADSDLVLEMSNCVVAGNLASDGAGIANGGRAVLMNVTLAGNLCSNVGCVGGLNNAENGAVATVNNSILWGNDGVDLAGPGLVVNFSDVSSPTIGLPGIGNIGEDPRFVDASGADYHLTADSAAIDAGTALGAPLRDVDGDLRPLGEGYDMGADEFPLTTTANPSATARLIYTDAQGSIVRLEIPAGAVANTTTIVYRPKDPDFVPDIPPGWALGSEPFDLEAWQNGVPITSFDVTITLRIRYADAVLANLFENTLALYRRTNQGWEIIGTRPGESYSLDVDGNLLTAYLRGFSRFGNMGTAISHRLFLPVSRAGVR